VSIRAVKKKALSPILVGRRGSLPLFPSAKSKGIVEILKTQQSFPIGAEIARPRQNRILSGPFHKLCQGSQRSHGLV